MKNAILTHMNIVQTKQQEIEKLCRDNDIGFLGLFGSVARGDDTEKSDVDLLVRFDARKNLFDLVDIEDQFAEVFGKKVDLVTEAAVHPYIKDYIYRDLQPVYGQPRR